MVAKNCSWVTKPETGSGVYSETGITNREDECKISGH
ncbi:hypothetical protein PI125_g26718 [Phytophthora idaei]|nr:hypothetical protein PI125_g26718 [Phytophthora idaei]KAG3121332.1 hypothetical protein PI126_g24446 [Phytophthora idaei]